MAQLAPPSSVDVDPFIFLNRSPQPPPSASASARIQQPDQAVAVELAPNASTQQTDQALTEEQRKAQLIRFYRPLLKAALNGDWESAERFFIQNQSSGADITERVNGAGMTILHVAANMGHEVFIRKLLRSGIFPKTALKLQDHVLGWTPLHYAATFGSLSAVKDLISEDNSLTQVLGSNGYTPLLVAATYAASKKVVWYLINKTTDDVDPPDCRPFSGVRGARLIDNLGAAGYYDICMYLFNRYPQLATESVSNWRAINCDLISLLVSRPSEFRSGSKLNFWERCIYHLIPNEGPVSISSDSGAPQPQQLSTLSTRIRPKLGKVIHWILGAALKATVYVPGFKRIRDEKYKHKCINEFLNVLCITMSQWDVNDIATYFQERQGHYYAASNGQIEIITAFIEHFPYFMDDSDVKVNILIRTIRDRRESVLNLIMGRGVTVKFLSAYNSTRETNLHVAAKLASYTRLSSVSCPSLQMQRELQWFQGVERLVRPSDKILWNKKGQTPREMFTTEHKDLVRDAEKWMKDTANSCMVVSTLIATVVFAAAFTIPGGNIDGTGIPIFLNRNDFMVFVASDAVGMFSSATSIIMFLSILTARYAEDDFLYALPKRLILGLASLFIAIASMMVAFGSALYMVLNQKFKWILFPIIGLTSVPVSLFVMLQLPLFIYMVRSTYGPSLIKTRPLDR